MLGRQRALIVLVMTGPAIGCAMRAGSSRDATSRTWATTVVTAQELESIVRQGSLMEALQRLRPEWLVSRGGAPYVTVDGAPPTDLSFLSTIPASTIREVRLERASSSVGHAAVASSGRVVVGDMIVVTTRNGGSR